MDIRTIRKLINLLKETGVAEIEVKTGEEAVRISLNASQCATAAPTTAVASAPVAAAAPTPAAATDSSTPSEDAIEVPNGHLLKSPMVGTAYLSPNPGAPVFTEVGKHVNKGDTVCFIEAMKMFNQIEADVSGTVKAILIDNEQPIEYDQPLFVIDPDGK